MKVLIIGGAGYIGSHVVLECLKQGYHVTVYDNLSTGSEENIFSETIFVKGDILDYATLSQIMMRKFDAIIHLAAFKAAGESMVEPEKYSINNIAGSLNILNGAIAAEIPIIIFSSSAAVYGEPHYLPIDENHPKEPSNYYGFTKLSIENFLFWYHKLKGIRYASLRYFNAAGYDSDGRVKGLEKNPANLLPIIMEVAIGVRKKLQIFGDDYNTEDGSGVRDYIHVTDLSCAHINALEYVLKNNENIIVNLGSEKGISVKRMLEISRYITKMKIPAEVKGRRAGDPAIVSASSKKAKELFNWEAKYSNVETLIQTTWNIYKNHMIK
jgi:UDP-glucose 4-epimerase